MIPERKKFLLKTIINEYIETANPVSSGSLVSKYDLDISPATVRNEMMALEEDAFIYQPHTSAGRIPTEKAYRLYLEEILVEKKFKEMNKDDRQKLEAVFNHDEKSYKKTAKLASELSGGTVFWAFHKNDLFYTGISNLFSQPEFKQVDAVCDVSIIIDRLEEIIDEIFEDLEEGEQVLIGSENPFGSFLSTVVLKYRHDNKTALFGIIGPLRMDYQRNLNIIKYIKNKFNK
jgi:heat-inducible transcriptional repressor